MLFHNKQKITLIILYLIYKDQPIMNLFNNLNLQKMTFYIGNFQFNKYGDYSIENLSLDYLPDSLETLKLPKYYFK